MNLEASLIAKIWQALQKPSDGSRERAIAIASKRIAEEGWADNTEIEDFLLDQDKRLDFLLPLAKSGIIEALSLPKRWVFSRPSHRNDADSGFQKLASVDIAALCICLERMGFNLTVSDLCARLKPHLALKPYLCDEEIEVLFYEENRCRLPPIFASALHRDWRGEKSSRFKTPTGYRVEYVHDKEGFAVRIKVCAPNYRKRKEPIKVECPNCGMTFMKGLRQDDQQHRAFHKRVLSVLEPSPNKHIKRLAFSGPKVLWVDPSSAKWKWDSVYERARIFKRELGFDFVQWSPTREDDHGVIGFIVVDERSRIVGAGSFRNISQPKPRWKLDWVWICPCERREGHLTKHWPDFRQRFGAFEIEQPISDEMQSFLKKHTHE